MYILCIYINIYCIYICLHIIYIYVYILSLYTCIYYVYICIHIMYIHAENFFLYLIKSNRNQIVFTIFRLIWNTNEHVRLLLLINRKVVNTNLSWFDLIRIRKDYSVCIYMFIYILRMLYICLAEGIKPLFERLVSLDVMREGPPLNSSIR